MLPLELPLPAPGHLQRTVIPGRPRHLPGIAGRASSPSRPFTRPRHCSVTSTRRHTRRAATSSRATSTSSSSSPPTPCSNIGYIGSHGVHQLFSTNDINNVPLLGQDPNGNYYWPSLVAYPVTGAARAAMILNQAVGTESDSFYGGSSIYHSLQTSLSYSSPKGITGKIAYTWTHSIDDSSSPSPEPASATPSPACPPSTCASTAQTPTSTCATSSPRMQSLRCRTSRPAASTPSILRHWTFNNIISIRGGIPVYAPHRRRRRSACSAHSPSTFPTASSTTVACTNRSQHQLHRHHLLRVLPAPTPMHPASAAPSSAPAVATHSTAPASSSGPPAL